MMKLYSITLILFHASSNLANSQNTDKTSTSAPSSIFSDCNGVVTTPGTQISSNGYPDEFSNSLDCWIDVQFEEGETIQLRFLTFDVNGKLDRFGTGCATTGSYLQLLDGFVSLGKPHCSYNPPSLINPMSSSGNSLTIHFKSKYGSNESSGGGYKLIVELAPKCYCEHSNGDSENNGILCGSRGAYQKTDDCYNDYWCTGASDESEAVPLKSKNELCEEATVLCGDEKIAPSCSLCPKNNDTILNSWCGGHCYYSEESRVCKELFTKLLVGKQTNRCAKYGIGYETLSMAKSHCASEGRCIGVEHQLDWFYLCSSISITETRCSPCNDVYKKQNNFASTEEFLRSEKGTRCKIRSSNIIKSFVFPSLSISNATVAISLCEKYCAMSQKCWGCSIQGTDSFQIDAITDCGKVENWTGLIDGEVSQKPACMEMNIVTKTETEDGTSWSMGTCFQAQEYIRENQYIERCCLQPGSYTLQCNSKVRPVGWCDGFIEFQGQKYCDDFIGLKAMRTVQVTAIVEKQSHNNNSDNEPSATNPDLIPKRWDHKEGKAVKCPKGTIDCSWCNKCYCEDHCNWEVCRLHTPPNQCLEATNSTWVWDSEKMYYVAQIKGCTFIPVAESECPDRFKPECTASMKNNEICEASTTLPDGNIWWDVNNCDRKDIFKCLTRLYSVTLEKSLDQEFGFQTENLTIVNISKSSPAEKSKLEIGDKIVSIDGASVATEEELVKLMPRAVNILKIGIDRAEEKTNDSTKSPSLNTTVKPEVYLDGRNKSNNNNEMNKYSEEKQRLIQLKKYETVLGMFLALGIGFGVYLFHTPSKLFKDTKILQKRLNLILKWFCLFMAIYMISILCERYFENRDATTVAYKKFNEKELDTYPTFSFCFRGDKFHWYNDHLIFDVYELNATQYEHMLKGQTSRKYKFNRVSGAYEKHEVFMKDKQFLQFNKSYLQISDILVNQKFVTEDLSNYEDSDESENSRISGNSIDTYYQNAETICFTRKSNDFLNSARKYDLLSFNRSIFALYPDTRLDIYIHYPGQLIKVFDNPSFTTDFHDTGFAPTDLTFNSLLEFRIFQQTILRKRANFKQHKCATTVFCITR